jgi:Uma2 family endonuclease
MSAALKLPFDMTVEQFLDWCPEDNVRWQLVDGEPQAMAPTRPNHGLLQAEVARLIGNHLVATGRPCSVVDAPGVVPQVRASTNIRIPDLGVTCAPVTAEDKHLREPVLLIEILSRGPTQRS